MQCSGPAFANTAGGTLLVGEERLANLVSDRIRPRIAPEIEMLPWRRTQALALDVPPSPSRPHHLVREGPTGGVYVRVARPIAPQTPS